VYKSKVLLASDGSDTSLKAAAYASRLMKTNPQIKLTVLVVAPEESGFTELDSAMQEKGREVLDKTLRVFASEGQNVESNLEKGDPAEVIIEFAERGKYDHIILGSRGVSQLRGAAIGSVSHKVIHLANCRVTLVK